MSSHSSTTLDKILKSDASGIFVLLLAFVVSLVFANAEHYPALAGVIGDSVYQGVVNAAHGFYDFLHHTGTVMGLDMTFHHWINDAAMAFFFLAIGLEVKREIFDEKGELNTLSKASLPLIAASAGVVVPGLVFYLLNMGDAEAMKGWATPAATDIVFALGALMAVKSRIPVSVKVFLLAIAVIDDLQAVLIIAFFYTSDLNLNALIGAAVCVGVMFVIGRTKTLKANPLVYLLAGTGLWVFMHASGIHATVAGVVTALMIPTNAKLGYKDEKGERWSLLKTLEHWLAPINAFFIIPLFALANAGVNFSVFTAESMTHSVTLGTALGLMLGKPVGIVIATYLAIRFTSMTLPDGMNMKHLVGVGILAGIGFTMSTFIKDLAYVTHVDYANYAALGVTAASVFMAVAGIVWFMVTCPKQKTVKVSH